MKRATPFGRPHRSVGGTRGQENTGVRQLCSGAGRTGTAFLTAPDATGRGTRGTFDATASGVGDPAGIDQVDLYANGAYVASDATSPYRIPVRTGSRSGKLTLTWQVYDKVGNRTTVVRPSRPTTRRRRCRSPRDRRTRRR